MTGSGGGGDRRGFQAGDQVTIRVPADRPPAEFVDAVRSSVRCAPGVEAAYVFQLVDETQTARLLVGAVLTDGVDEEAAMVGFVDAVAVRFPPAAELDFVVLVDDLRPIVSEHVEAIT